MLKEQLKIELKQWEHSFIKEHGRDPGKEDIKKLPEIRNMYKKYARLRKGNTTDVPHAVSERKSDVKADNAQNTTIIELGPTPQIYGKAMSIFDMNLSPIKASQVIMTGVAEDSAPENESKDEQPQLPAEDELLLVKRQLSFAHTSPVKRDQSIVQKVYGPNSPLKWSKENLQISIKTVSPLKRTPIKSMTQQATSFSPSPLVKRPLTRSLLELVEEHKAIVEEFKQIEGQQDDDGAILSSKTPDNIFTQEDETLLESERKTIKTRRRRILRRKAIDDGAEEGDKSIADEILKLKRQRINEFMGLDDDPSAEDSTSTKAPEQGSAGNVPQKKVKKRNKKYNLVSNNFKRLKLPTKNSRRWNNRRR